jgi:hypothetical protein
MKLFKRHPPQVPSISSTNITTYRIVAVITAMLYKCLNRSSWQLVSTSCHLSPFQWRISQIPTFSNTNITASQIAKEDLNIASTTLLIFMTLGMDIMPPEAISTVHYIILFHQ